MSWIGKMFGLNSAAPPRVSATQLKHGRGWTTEVVGESKYQDALSRSYRRHGGRDRHPKVMAELVPELDNPYDENAVMIFIDGQKIGYLRREKAAEYRTVLGEKTGSCSAKIVGGFERDDGGRAFFGVKLNMSWPPSFVAQGKG
ncbi:HIRAN domain-containing protein [Filomicrobium insigne]|uniref:HIRAN domain-containing protein n=1 Tax=Filomicrobium insigne TaxID=418854 RepID=A0A1H0SCV3_9HYPH|nr:HIRAN domain-containing protein [Filomicrobium insigne]SDP39517.1 HIRAN domain-containing protein [Filomicrobium insigne]